MILILLLYALFGFSFTLGKISLFFASPFFIVGFRMLLGGLGLVLAFYFFQSNEYRLRLKDWPYFLQVTTFGIVIPYCCRAWGLQYISSTKAAFLFTLMPLFTAFFSFLFHKEFLTLKKSMGLLLGFLGMMPTLFTSTLEEDLTGGIAFFSLPELAILVAVASFGYNFIAIRNLVRTRGCPPLVANAATMLMGGIISMNLAFFVEPTWIYKSPWILLGLLTLQIIISNIVCANLQASLLLRYSPTFMAFASFLTPICAAFFGWMLLNERIQFEYIISLTVVALGLALFYADEVQENKIQTESFKSD